MKRFWVSAVIAALAFGLALMPSYSHGDVDQQFEGPFTASAGLVNPSSLAQSFTPGEPVLVAVDVFLTTDGETTSAPIEFTLNIRGDTVAGALGPILATTRATVPGGTYGIPTEPYLVHADLDPSVTLTPGTRYVIQIEPVTGLFWANTSGSYAGGNLFIGTTPYPTLDFGFRTYFTSAVEDTSPPVITYDLDPEPPTSGWYRGDVTLDWTVTEDESEATFDGCADVSVTVDQDPTAYSCFASSAGGSAGPVTVEFGRDTVAPEIDAAIKSGTTGLDSWYRSDVIVEFTCTDDRSGIPEDGCPEDETLSGDGAAIFSTARTVLDAAGNESEPSNVITVNIDSTKPVVQASASPAPNLAGWNNTEVTVTFAGTDATSGIASCEEAVTLSDDGAGQSATGGCTDVAGNAQSASAVGIHIDRTKPVVTILPARPPDTVDGYNHAIEFTASGDDGAGSGIAYCDPPETYSGPVSALVTVEMSCADNAGNVGSATATFAYLDTTPPVIGFQLAPALPAGGWYTSDVTLTWTVTEAESPESLEVTGCADQHVTADRAFAMYTCAATSAGGAASVVEVAFGRDATKPAVQATVTGVEGLNGWFTGDVAIAFACTDAGSGIETDTLADASVTTEGAGQSVAATGACVDRAGNVADPLTVAGIDVDKSGPSAVLAMTSGTLGLDGWYVSNVVVSTTGTDEVSGPVTCTAGQTLSADALSHTFEGSCTNAAGLETEAAPLTLKLDKTSPVLEPALSTDEVGIGGTLSVTPNASDATSGVASSSCGAIDTASLGVRMVTCTAKDRAGNASSTSVEYEVVSALGVIVYGFRPPASGGYGTFSFGGGTFEELLAASGCPRGSSAFFFNKTDGTFAVWIPGAQVAVVNEEILALFGGTPPLPEGVIFTARCA